MSKNYSLVNLKKENVLSAINEFDILGEEYFLKNYGFGKSRSYFLLYNKKFYPSKAIAGVAHKYFNGLVMGKKYGRDFSGGDKTVKNCLSNLGYSVTSPKDLKTNEKLIITNSKFLKKVKYTRNSIFKKFFPNKEFPSGTDWNTLYVEVEQKLIIFLNIGVPGRTGHDFDNFYDNKTETITWFSKPNRHSKTPQIQRLINGELTPYFFARWDNNDLEFSFLGIGKLLNFQNIISKSYIKNRSSKTVRFEHNCKFFIDNIAIEEKVTSNDIDDIEVSSSEGRRIKSHHFRLERDPLIVKKKKENALNKDGKLECEVCSFDFKKFYGRRGDGFIECHHVNPVSEMQEDDETRLDDLALICSNCHRMIHRKEKTLGRLTVEELKSFLQSNKL